MELHHMPPTPAELERAEFHEKFARSFSDARFDGVRDAVAALEELAWRQYCERRQPAH
ncbi:MAG: flavodoxin family protein [Pseudoduganella sp.]|jgi:hypothetical protein|nr:flavodoxin family protein [Pseudoduganella sp.]